MAREAAMANDKSASGMMNTLEMDVNDRSNTPGNTLYYVESINDGYVYQVLVPNFYHLNDTVIVSAPMGSGYFKGTFKANVPMSEYHKACIIRAKVVK